MSVDRSELQSGRDRGGLATARIGGSVTDDGRRYRVVWFRRRTRFTALFRVSTDDRVATLQHIRAIRVSARPELRRADIDPDATLDDLPDAALELMRADGFEPADEEGSR